MEKMDRFSDGERGGGHYAGVRVERESSTQLLNSGYCVAPTPPFNRGSKRFRYMFENSLIVLTFFIAFFYTYSVR